MPIADGGLRHLRNQGLGVKQQQVLQRAALFEFMFDYPRAVKKKHPDQRSTAKAVATTGVRSRNLLFSCTRIPPVRQIASFAKGAGPNDHHSRVQRLASFDQLNSKSLSW